ncbi:MAG: DUF951 domain-containing protein [Chloroflexi bacterium]|nr:DUF951 domain-containing protein [Chloroflexota bacterium]
MSFELDARVRLKKPHPCGGTEWRIDRLGADIGLICLTCGRRVLIDRVVLERRIVRSLARRGADRSRLDAQ